MIKVLLPSQISSPLQKQSVNILIKLERHIQQTQPLHEVSTNVIPNPVEEFNSFQVNLFQFVGLLFWTFLGQTLQFSSTVSQINIIPCLTQYMTEKQKNGVGNTVCNVMFVTSFLFCFRIARLLILKECCSCHLSQVLAECLARTRRQ